jgi:hypothetical protein
MKGGQMKRITTIILILALLTVNYAYATMSANEIAQTIERAQHEQLTQKEVEELLITIITLVDLEEIMLGDFSSIETIIQPNQVGFCIFLLLFVWTVGYSAVIYPINNLFRVALAVFAYALFNLICI